MAGHEKCMEGDVRGNAGKVAQTAQGLLKSRHPEEDRSQKEGKGDAESHQKESQESRSSYQIL